MLIISDNSNDTIKPELTNRKYILEEYCKRKCLMCFKPCDNIVVYCKTCFDKRKLPHRKPNQIKLKQKTRIEAPSTSNDSNAQKMIRTVNYRRNEIPLMEQIPLKSTKIFNPIKCTICTVNECNGTLIHGNTSHSITCYPCAKGIIKSTRKCPICRKKLDKIVKTFIVDLNIVDIVDIET